MTSDKQNFGEMREVMEVVLWNGDEYPFGNITATTDQKVELEAWIDGLVEAEQNKRYLGVDIIGNDCTNNGITSGKATAYIEHERGDIEARARGTQRHQHQPRLENVQWPPECAGGPRGAPYRARGQA